jgi:hypothetical protein
LFSALPLLPTSVICYNIISSELVDLNIIALCIAFFLHLGPFSFIQ